MTLQQLPAKKTPMTGDTAAKYLAQGYHKVTGKSPGKAILGLLVGQWGVETAKGQSVYNYNFGNTMPVSTDKYYQMLHASEVVNGVNTPMDEKFAAYLTPLDGAIAYINVLKGRAHWWKGLQSGTPEGFIDGLTTLPKYFTGNPATYLNAMKSHMATYASSISKYATSWLGITFQVIVGLVLGTGAMYIYRRKKGYHGLLS